MVEHTPKKIFIGAVGVHSAILGVLVHEVMVGVNVMARRPDGGRPGRCEGEQGLLSGGATGTCVLVCVCVCVCGVCVCV